MQQFKTESKKLMEMMVHSIYTNKEIFLRELISNASDAIDKMYVKSLDDPSISFDKDKFYIEVIPNKEERTLRIKDTGIGMTKEELEENLGTIAHSDSLAFKTATENKDVANIIGQFGVGFYSAFMVADKVEVISKSYQSDQAYVWASEGSDGFTIEETDKDEPGTEIVLHLREDEEDESYSQYAEEYRLKSLVKQYSNYIRYPIYMTVTERRPVEKEEGDEGDTEYEEVDVQETLNSMTPIWEKSKNDLSDEDYIEFYKQEHFGFDEPLAWVHMVADGTISYRAILYIPGSTPYDYYSKDYKKGLALYSRGVKIMDHCEDLLPDHFSFVKGVVSSEDLSLNLSRETLQQNRQLIAIARKIESKITDELKKLLKNDKEKYEKFFENFGIQLKGGIYQSFGANKDSLADLLIFPTSKHNGMRSLKDVLNAYGYPEIKEDEEDQEGVRPEPGKIYYATGDSVEKIDHLPALEKLKEQGKEVLYLTEDIDEFTLKAMNDYEGHPFQSVLAEDFEAEESGEEDSDDQEKQKEVFSKMEEILGDEVVGVKKSRRLNHDAVTLVAQGDISIDMEKTFMNQPDGQFMKAQKVLEINTSHPVFAKLEELAGSDSGDFEKYTKILYDQARLIEGLPIDDPVNFARSIQDLM